jgi:outer membrane protein assembly factor BamD
VKGTRSSLQVPKFDVISQYSLDQTDTFKAIDKLQTFIDTYPNSEYRRQMKRRVFEENEKKVLKMQ